jgi:hypothetical protein
VGEQAATPAGVSGVEITRTAVAQVGHRTADALTPQQLSKWLLEQRLAERLPDGRLHATKLGASIGTRWARCGAPEIVPEKGASAAGRSLARDRRRYPFDGRRD